VTDVFELFTDGGSRGNPGEAGCGFVLFKNGEPYKEGCLYLGTATNNQAEYRGLIEGLILAHTHNIDELIVKMDSELIVKQMQKLYKVRDQGLKILYDQVVQYCTCFRKITFVHVPRAENKYADMLANKAMDTREPVEQSRGVLFTP